MNNYNRIAENNVWKEYIDMVEVDARGLSCPEPVIMLRKALAGGEPCQMIVDNHAAKENTSRYGKSQGYQVAVQEQGSEYTLTFTK